MDTRRLQQKLKALGFDPGPTDGIWGRRTSAAVRHFQEAEAIEVTGLADPATVQRLEARAGDAPDTTTLVWLEEAQRLMGVKEIAGAGSNKQILDWAKNLDIAYAGDDIAWCGLFTAHCVGATLPQEPLPTNPLGARNWAKFGERCAPQLGAVLVFWRVKKEGWLGHVGFYAAEDKDAYHVLGGNQSNSVSVARVGKNRFLDARWPASASALATGAKVHVNSDGTLSRDEA